MPGLTIHEAVFDSRGRHTATFVRMADGSPIRRILPGGRNIPVGIMQSRKSGLPMHYEGKTERSTIMVCEAERAAMTAASAHTNDFDYIRTAGGTKRVTPEDLATIHLKQRTMIEMTLATPFDGPTVVVSHHAPSARSLRNGRATEALDGAFASDLETVIEKGRPELWIHGHLHARQDYVIGATRIVANPRGFIVRRGRGENAKFEREVPDFDERFVVAIGK